MARGASEAGIRPAVAVIGDSTFLHSGVTPLMDAVAADADMTLIIADNEVVAMTGAQPTLLPSTRLRPLVLGLGVDPAHCHVIDAHPRRKAENAAIIRRELEHPGLSVIIAARPCIEAAKARKTAVRRSEPAIARSGAGPRAPASDELGPPFKGEGGRSGAGDDRPSPRLRRSAGALRAKAEAPAERRTLGGVQGSPPFKL
jgi:indolepyruvate ferredoxin oxidoreductase alpha subunit